MFSFREPTAAVVAVLMAGLVQAQSPAQGQMQGADFPGIGRAATAKELAAWDIDVRPDFKGLPKGAGTVDQGLEIWESKCASCHGVFGESNQFFSPIVGGTTEEDIASGKVARLNDRGYPARTTLMKLSQVSTLWDYIRRAMPWNAPKSLSVDEVYGVTAYLLNMGNIIPSDFKLSDQNIAEVQKRLPNRNGMTTEHGLWPGAGFGNLKPDVESVACMSDCVAEPKVGSFLPDFARNAHGNLAEQNRLVGAQHGADTTKPAPASLEANAASYGSSSVVEARPAVTGSSDSKTVAAGNVMPVPSALLEKNACVACHGMDTKLIGPSFKEIAKKYAGRSDAVSYLTAKIKSGGVGVWGPIPMPSQGLPESDAKAIAQWLADGASK